MALVKPIAQGVSAFNATQDKTFGFASNGGSQVVANRLTIRLQSDNSVVYQNKIETYRFEQIVPANTLINGNYYNFYFNTYDADGNESEASNISQFYCFDTPTLTLTNLPSNNLIEASNYTFGVTYNQEQDETLNYLKFYLYNNLNVLISESDFYYGQEQIPVSFEHEFNGFENNENYKIEVVAMSTHGMIVSTSYSFFVRYYYPEVFSLISLENICDKGYVKINTNIIITKGETAEDFTPPTYIDSEYLDVHEYHNWVQWTEGFLIKPDFTLTLFMKVGRLGRFAILGTEENGFTIDLIREIPYGETIVKDRFEVNGYVDGVRKVHQTSNYVDIVNQKSYYLIWFRKNGNVYDLQLEVMERGTDTMDWENSDIDFERVSDFTWTNENYNQGVEFIPQADDISSIFTLTNLKLLNGIYDNMDITNNVTRPFTTDKPIWDYDTRIDCDFNENINSGNIDVLLNSLKYIKIKRRKKGAFNWITVKQHEINSAEDLFLTTEDYYVPSGEDFEYAFVPVMEGNIEGTYIINDISTKFNCVTIADSTGVFNLRANIVYSGDTSNTSVGTYTPLKGKYLIVQKNNEIDYWSGSISAMMLGYGFENTHKIDRNDIVQQTNDFCDFLKNMEAKIIKDWNGRIHLVRFVGSPSVGYTTYYGNGVTQVTANWIEQGRFDNQEDLYNNGLIDTNN